MADRFGQQFTQSLQGGLFVLDGYLSVGASGAISGQVLPLWMKSITRNSAGNYTVVLSDTWFSLNPSVLVQGANAVTANVACVVLVNNSSGSSQGVNQINFICNVAGTAADVPSGGGLTFHVLAHNSGVV